MSIKISDVGWDTAGNKISQKPNKVVLPTSDGRVIIIVADHNSTTSPSGFGDQSGSGKLEVWELDSSFSNPTLRASVNAGDLRTPEDQFSADMYSDGSIGIAYWRKDTDHVCFRKISAAWAVGAEQDVATVSNTLVGLDVSVSEGDVPMISFAVKQDSDPTLRLRLFVRGTTAGAWTLGGNVDIMTSQTPIGNYTSTSVAFLRGGTSSARPMAVAIASASSNSDKGSRVYTGVVDEASGSIVNIQLRKTYLAGNMDTSLGEFSRRTYIFPVNVGEYYVAHMEVADKKTLLLARHTFDGAAWAEPMPAQTTTLSFTPLSAGRFAASYSNDTVNFYFIQRIGGNDVAVNVIGIVNRTGNSVRWSGPYRWDNNDADPDRFYPMAGTGRYGYLATRHAMVYFNAKSSTKYTARGHRSKLAPAPYEVKPDGSAIISGTPEVSLKIQLGLAFPQSKHKAVWQFASDSGFTTNVKTYTQDDTKFVKIENTESVGSFYYIQDVLPASLSLSSGTWFVRAAMIDEFGNQGPWSTGGSTTLSHPPAAANLLPNGYTVASDVVQFTWDFTDPLSTDQQTAYQLEVSRVDTGAVVLDTGKVASGNTSTIRALGSSLLGVDLRWRVRLWDVDDTQGEYSDYATFTIAGAPGVTIDAPTPGSVVPSGTPQILFTPTTDGARRVKAYVVNVFADGSVVRTSGSVPVDVASGTQLSWRVPSPLLEPGVNYTVQATVTDEVGLEGASSVVPFTVSWVAPPATGPVTIDITHFNIEGEGYVLLDWSGTTADPNFYAWVVERKDDLMSADHLTVIEAGEWAEVDEITTVSQKTYKDYFAPSSYRSTYRIRQMTDTGGDKAISQGETEYPVYPLSEGYWIIEPESDDGNPAAFRLANVTADELTPEWEETTYTIIGRGRHVDRGDYLGVTGSLTAQLRDTNYSTARQKKLRLEEARNRETALYLRNPFGDVYHVNISNIQISRIAGVGLAEFVDVTVPYSEVSL